jgi:hypothetical protein
MSKGMRWSLEGLRKSVEHRLDALPTIKKTVELPVYVIHNSPDAEDYFFIFDFEDFVEASRSGLFVAPKLRVWAGRSDFRRRMFARQFRESFAREFDIARAQLAAQEPEKQGWFGFLRNAIGDAASLSQIVSNVVLLVGVGAGKMILSRVLPKAWLTGKSDERKLEEAIADTQSKVDAALENIEITLHPELYSHAYQGQPPGRLSGMDYDAWPLPGFVKHHLGAGKSRSWF